jgi:hypothetical protein
VPRLRPLRIPLRLFGAAFLLLLLIAVGHAAAATPEEMLAARYSPVMMLRPQAAPCDSEGEAYVPIPVTSVLNNPRVALERLPGGGTSSAVELAAAPGASGVAGLGPAFELDLPGDSANLAKGMGQGY